MTIFYSLSGKYNILENNIFDKSNNTEIWRVLFLA